jgi:hypothetical protein
MESQDIEIHGYKFRFITDIEIDRAQDGRPIEYMPQDQYRNEKGLKLNKYGKGPFCRFRIPAIRQSGVYIIRLDAKPIYVGECQNLGSRFNIGYGIISPRNCYIGGQNTNCRLNNAILVAIRQGHKIDLLFFETQQRFLVEKQLIKEIGPIWNRRGENMDWEEAKEQIKARIIKGQDINTERSSLRKILETGIICTKYDYAGDEGFLVKISNYPVNDIQIPWSMLERCFPALKTTEGYGGRFFRRTYPKQAEDHPCHVHVVGQIFKNAGLAREQAGQYFLIND